MRIRTSIAFVFNSCFAGDWRMEFGTDRSKLSKNKMKIINTFTFARTAEIIKYVRHLARAEKQAWIDFIIWLLCCQLYKFCLWLIIVLARSPVSHEWRILAAMSKTLDELWRPNAPMLSYKKTASVAERSSVYGCRNSVKSDKVHVRKEQSYWWYVWLHDVYIGQEYVHALLELACVACAKRRIYHRKPG